MKDRLAVVGIVGLTALATAGWMRQPQVIEAAPVAPHVQAQPALVRQVAAVAPKPVQIARVDRSVQVRNRAVYDDEPAVVEKGRSKKASAAIIAGSAAGGAAIGGLAGGGKGAAIGAIAGGAGGLVYDRMTHKKTPADEEGTRSTGKSAAIIGGSAASGAAIGGLAGGGKGAAIGAVAGGATGLIYDRVTRKK